MHDAWAALREAFEELPDHWDDSYWWADRWWLQILVAGALAAMIDVGSHYLKLSMTRAMLADIAHVRDPS